MADVPHPMFISSRLMAALKIEGVGTLHIGKALRDAESRISYAWVVEDANGRELGKSTGPDRIRSGVGADVDYRDAMGSLLSFLGACAESWPDGENADLFPAAIGEWAAQNSDELSLAAYDLEGDEE